MFTRYRRRKDRGSLLIEAIATVGLVAIFMTGYTTSVISANQAQNRAVNEAVAAQLVQSQLEKARSLKWAQVGTQGTAAAEGGAEELLPAGTTPVRDGGIDGLEDPKRIRGAEASAMTLRTAVGWDKAPVNCTGDVSLCKGYGQKVMVVEVSWRDNESDQSDEALRKITQSALLAPDIGEAVPSSVPAA